MKHQKPAQIDGVKERYVAGAGATPVLRTYRLGYRRAVRSRPLSVMSQLWAGLST